MFIPINNHVEVEPLNQESIVASGETTYEEKGKVLSIGFAHTSGIKVGDIVFFDSWLIARYPDNAGKVRYLVPFDAIRAIETDSPPVPTSTSGEVNLDFPPLKHE